MVRGFNNMVMEIDNLLTAELAATAAEGGASAPGMSEARRLLGELQAHHSTLVDLYEGLRTQLEAESVCQSLLREEMEGMRDDRDSLAEILHEEQEKYASLREKGILSEIPSP